METELERLQRKNAVLRALIARVPGAACVYCGLTDISLCRLGFPGCSQADDILCGDDDTMKRLLAENRELKRPKFKPPALSDPPV